MLTSIEISKLMWQCAYVYGCQKDVQLSARDLRVLRAMRYYFRADERPPQSLSLRAMGIVSLYRAHQKGLTRRLKVITRRDTRLEALRMRERARHAKAKTSQVPLPDGGFAADRLPDQGGGTPLESTSL